MDTVENRYNIIKKIGEGGFGTVYLAKNKKTNKHVAIKVITIVANKQHRILNEIKALKTIEPQCVPYLACYRDSFIDKKRNAMVIEMEYIPGVNILAYTQKLRNDILLKYQNGQSYKKEGTTLITICKLVLIAMLKVLKYIHSKNILHNDIKPSNLMVSSERIPVMVDFGLSCFVNKDKFCENKAGTSLYIPPEIIFGVKNSSSDLWSLAATIYSLMTGENVWGVNPYGETVLKNVINKIKTKTEPKNLNTGDYQLDSVVNGFLILDPNKRLTIDQALNILV